VRPPIAREPSRRRTAIFLDEIGELELSAQVKLLRVLEVGELQRVGSDRSIRVDVRVIGATNRDLARMVRKKSFREDLYYRINMCPIFIPPLRERRDEIRILLDYFFQKIGPPGRKRPVLGRALRQYIYHQYEFPGNIRELKNLAQYIAMIDTGRPISIGDLPERYQEDAQRTNQKKESEIDSERAPLTSARDIAEKERLLEVVQARRGNIRRVCEDLTLSRARVYQLLRKHAIEPAEYR
jgi:transcriptional regulator with GAF, ATPase, and Fis domain